MTNLVTNPALDSGHWTPTHHYTTHSGVCAATRPGVCPHRVFGSVGHIRWTPAQAYVQALVKVRTHNSQAQLNKAL